MRPRLTTLKDLKAKYGPNWGLDSIDPKKPPPKPAPTMEELAEHYRKYDLGWKPKREASHGAGETKATLEPDGDGSRP